MNELAGELAGAFSAILASYRERAKLTAEQAVQRIAQVASEDIDRILNEPPEAVSWLELDALAYKDAGLALQRWQQIKEAARKEVRSGFRAARVVEDAGGPWDRARFLAVRAELTETWQPLSAMEQQLVDQLAQWQLLLWQWQEALSTWTTHATLAPRQARKGKRYETMRLSESEALEGAARKVEQMHRLYLRTLKALQDQRRPRPAVAVRHAKRAIVGPLQISMGALCFPSFSDKVPSTGEM
jgi:hypothetical protein